jgi:hypothetical protein
LVARRIFERREAGGMARYVARAAAPDRGDHGRSSDDAAEDE